MKNIRNKFENYTSLRYIIDEKFLILNPICVVESGIIETTEISITPILEMILWNLVQNEK